jgi:mycothiol maleylpyruvate isomerase-like protein
MSVDRSFVELNRLATDRMRTLASGLTDEELLHPVGKHWTVAIVFAHLAFLDRRAQFVLDATGREGKVVNPDYDIFVNDLALPLFAAIPPRRAAEIAIETAMTLDWRLEAYPVDLLELVYAERRRYIFRADHRNEHLDEAEAALKSGVAS